MLLYHRKIYVNDLLYKYNNEKIVFYVIFFEIFIVYLTVVHNRYQKIISHKLFLIYLLFLVVLFGLKLLKVCKINWGAKHLKES